MAGRDQPPEGTPPGGGEDDEFRSTVFDESFVRAARLREASARERQAERDRAAEQDETAAEAPESAGSADTEGAPAAAPERARGDGPRGGFPGAGRLRRPRISGQFVGLLLVVVLAFGAAIYMGARSPYPDPQAALPQIPLRATVVPLVPRGTVPGAEPAELFRRSPAADFGTGPEAVEVPRGYATEHFTARQVQLALATARSYVIASSMHPDVLAGRAARPVRNLLSEGQRTQFDRSIRAPAPDGRYGATGWLVRFDPAEAVPDEAAGIRVDGGFTVSQPTPEALEVHARHVLVYPLRPTAAGASAEAARASLFTVRREVRMRFTPQELRTGRLTVAQTQVQAGPLPCAEDTHDWLRPLLAGEDVGADGSVGTDPYAGDHDSRTALCGVLARSAQPDLDD